MTDATPATPIRPARYWRHTVRCPYSGMRIPTGIYERTEGAQPPSPPEERPLMTGRLRCPVCDREYGWGSRDSDLVQEEVLWSEVPARYRRRGGGGGHLEA